MRSSLILLPVIAYILFILFFYRKNNDENISNAFVKSHLVLFVFIAVSTELLSLFNEVSFSFLLLSWLLFLLAGFALVFMKRGDYKPSPILLKKTSLIHMVLSGTIALILLTTLFTAIVYPPNNYDSMTYHLPRILHWISNNSVSFYPTEITRQNYLMPLAEFAIMHLQILTGGDLYANLVQWVSFLVLICLGAVVAEELGLDKKLQLITAIIIATLPMAILQASSTQNDLVVSVFVMSFGLFMLRLRANFNVENLLFAALSLGLALLTKGTAYIYCAALGLSLAVPLLWTRRRQFSQFLKAVVALTLVVIVALTLNTGHICRNVQLYGGLLPTEATDFRNQDMSAMALAGTILKNLALHLGTPNEQINSYELSMVNSLLGEKLNDPRTTLSGPFHIPYSIHEDKAGNLIHILIMVLGVVVLIFVWYRGHRRKSIWYSIGIILGAILFCWVLKWQPWSSRLHTPLFAMAAPLLAIIITSGVAAKRIGYFISLILILYSVPFALGNSTRSIVSLEWANIDRKQLYFQNWRILYADYNLAMSVTQKEIHGEVGLYMRQDDWEYPFWVLSKRKETKGSSVTFRAVGVKNVSRIIGDQVFLPSIVIATKPIEEWEYSHDYVSIYNSAHVSVLKRISKN